MIIITGPGRCGTSVIAQLYKELGFDPGGKWYPSVRAGLEAQEIAEINNAITGELGVDPLIRGHRSGILQRHPHVKNFVRAIKPLLPSLMLSKARELLDRRQDRTGGLSLIDWDKFDDVVVKYRKILREMSRSHQVVKDPRFSWTLPVWAAAEAQIAYVVFCTRALDSMVNSRLATGHLETRSLKEAKNSLIYGTGTCLSALYSYDIPHSIIKFPGFLDDAETLYATLQFPQPVSYEQFSQAFNNIVDKKKVHEQQSR